MAQRAPWLCAMFALGFGHAALARAHGGKTHTPPAKPSPEEMAAFEAAKPVFEQHCFRCHTTHGSKAKRKALAHLKMDKYPFTGHHAAELAAAIREVLGATKGSEASMPDDDPGAVKGDALAKILAWADAYDRAHPKRPATKSPAKPHHP